jgi:hypothetical protein
MYPRATVLYQVFEDNDSSITPRAVAQSGITEVRAGLQRAASPLTGGSGAVPPIHFPSSLPPKAAKKRLCNSPAITPTSLKYMNLLTFDTIQMKEVEQI